MNWPRPMFTRARLFLILGALNGFLAVALGAFGAHAIRGQVSDYHYDVFQTAVQYQVLHALALLVVGLLAFHFPSPWLKRAAWLFLVELCCSPEASISWPLWVHAPWVSSPPSAASPS